MMEPPTTPPIYGLLAEFSSASDLVAAANRVREAGYVRTDAYSPFPIEELTHAMAIPHTKLPLIVLAAGILGGIGGFVMQAFTAGIDYPFNIGGRSYFSWPSFIPVTFECVILSAGLAAIVCVIVLNGLPMPYHPVFNVPSFEKASRDGFFLCIEAMDPRFDLAATRNFLLGLAPTEVTEVPQ